MIQSTIRIAADKIIYIDPLDIEGEPMDADIILISHNHGDHFSPQDIKKAMKDDNTKIVIPASCKLEAQKQGYKNILHVEPLKDYIVEGIAIRTVPAYNTNKNFHPKGSRFVGYILKVKDALYYFAGDTDIIPEMADIKADVIFLPVGGTYTMTAQEAAKAANMIKPQIAVPIHFADVVGTMEDAKTFIKLVEKPIRGVILK